MRKWLSLLVFGAFWALPLAGKSATVAVRSQAEFDALSATLSRTLQEGSDTIDVRFLDGVYYFSDKHLRITGYSCPSTVVRIDGGGATLIGAGEDLTLKRRKKACPGYDWRCGIIDLDSLRDMRPFGPMKRALGTIEILDEAAGLCRFKADEKKLKHPGRMAVQFTSWYLGFTCPVTKIEGGYIYFTVDKLVREGNYYNIEGDLRYGAMPPKYQLINSPEAEVHWKDGKLRVRRKGRYHLCRASQLLILGDCKFKSLEFSNLHVLGNSDSAEVLMHIYRTGGEVSIHHCSFRGIRNLVLAATPATGVILRDNLIEGCYRGFFRDNTEASGTRILHNTFRDNQLFINNYFDVTCHGKDFRIAGNTFEDFTYGAIGVGMHFANPEAWKPVTSGVVEGNEIYYTEAFRREPTRTLMDSGAIYCWTSNAGVTIRDNYIHDYTGGKDNRGIFGDDGTCNVTVTGNRIERIANSYCIDFRRVESVETRADSYVKKTNVGIRMSDNIVDGKVRFEPRSAR